MLNVLDLTFGYSKSVMICEGLYLSVRAGHVVGIMGPSGCGKSTLLRLIGGFLVPWRGQIIIDGTDAQRLPPSRRPTSTVFQRYALFPNMSVHDNICFGLRVRRQSIDAINRLVAHLAEVMELSALLNNDVETLSGGERQRVALARALAVEPKLLLLDEPLSAVEERLRDSLRTYVRQVLKERCQTAVLVSHTFQDAASVCDTVAFWDRTSLTEPRRIGEWIIDPRSSKIAFAVGYRNIVSSAWLHRVSNGKTEVALNGSLNAVIPDAAIRISADAVPPRVIRSSAIVRGTTWRGTTPIAIALLQDQILEVPVETALEDGAGINVDIDVGRIIGLKS